MHEFDQHHEQDQGTSLYALLSAPTALGLAELTITCPCSHEHTPSQPCRCPGGPRNCYGTIFLFPDHLRIPCHCGTTILPWPTSDHNPPSPRCIHCNGRGWSPSLDLTLWLQALADIIKHKGDIQ